MSGRQPTRPVCVCVCGEGLTQGWGKWKQWLNQGFLLLHTHTSCLGTDEPVFFSILIFAVIYTYNYKSKAYRGFSRSSDSCLTFALTEETILVWNNKTFPNMVHTFLYKVLFLKHFLNMFFKMCNFIMYKNILFMIIFH